MRTIAYAIAAVMLVCIGAVAHAADLGKPAVAPPAVTDPIPDQWTSLFVEGGMVGQFSKGGDKQAVGIVGLGYNYHYRGTPWVVGGLIRYGFSAEGNSDAAVLSFNQPISVAVRMGYLAQPSTMLYGMAGFSKSIDSDFRGPLVGVGAELPVLGMLRLGVEYTAQFDRKFTATDDVVHNIGVFARLPF